MYTCIIADDNLLHRDLLALHLSRIGRLEIRASCTNGLEAYRFLTEEPVDIVFSDVNMPELSGLQLVKSLQSAPVFVFASDYPEFAAESYELDVIDYIVKPVSFERLLKAVNKAIEYIELKKLAAEKPAMQPNAAEDYFFIRESSEIVKLRFEDVAYIESMGNFSKIYLVSGRFHVALVILKNLENQLPASFFIRVHKQYIINHAHLSSIGAGDITLCEKYTIPLSQSYRQCVLDKLVEHKIVNRNPG